MTRVRLLVIAAMALMAFGAVGTAVAQAEESKDGPQPAILCLIEPCASELTAKFKGAGSELGSLGGKSLTGTGVETTLKGCKDLEVEPKVFSKKDTNLCENVTLTFTGVKQGKVECRSENAKGEKAKELGLVTVVVDLHLASEETLPAKVLQPLLLFKVLGTTSAAEEKEELTINCGGVKDKVRGVIGCLLSLGLKNIPTTEEVEVACKINATTKDKETGDCELLCAWLTEHPFESNLGAGFEDSWMTVNAKGAFSKDIFIDD